MILADHRRHGVRTPSRRHRPLKLLIRLGALSGMATVLLALAAVPSAATGCLRQASSTAQDQVSLTLLYTNDLHAMMVPFEEEGQMVGGFSRISTLVQQIRQEEENVLLVDGGDTFVEDQHLEGNYFRGEPVIKLMNQIKYDLAVPGNHDFEFGLDVLAQRIQQAEFPYLAANIVAASDADQDAQTVTTLLRPYVVLTVAGVKIGFLGLAQPLHDFPGIEIKDTLQMAQKYVPQIRQEADIVVVITHEELAKDYQIVDNVAGIDLLLAAHEHAIEFEHGLMRNGTLIAKTSAWGREVGKIDLTAEKAADGFRLKEAQVTLLPVTSDIAEDGKINQVLEPYLSKAGRYRNFLVPAVVGAVLVVVAVLFLLMRRTASESGTDAN